jgi:hypothetical protein
MIVLDYLKAIYKAVGVDHPRSSLAVVMILGAVLFAGVWLFAAKLVEKDRLAVGASSPKTGAAVTSGDKSPATTGANNSVVYSAPPEKKPDHPSTKGKE